MTETEFYQPHTIITGDDPSQAVPLVTTPHAMDVLLGRQLDVYDIRAFLGQGAMGRVYLAQHRDLHRPVALKILAPQVVLENGDYVIRFQNEGRAAASLVHPNIVTVHAIGEADGYHFLEMEFLPGQSLQSLIRSEQRLEPIRATRIGYQISEGLSLAHSTGMIHQDLKPDNILMSHQGAPKLADFGLAKRLAGLQGGPEGLMGTPHFMAPELFRGESAGPASDVYALGVTYFLMLTGAFPFHGKSLTSLMNSVLHDPIPNLRKLQPEIPLEMAECVNMLMAYDPKQRPQNGVAAAQLLSAILGELQDIDWLLREAFGKDPRVSWESENGCYRIRINLADGRHQKVFVEASKHVAAERLLLIYSICCPSDPAYYEFALRLNSEIAHGGLAIRSVEGRDHFVMLDSYPRGTVDVEEIRRSVREMATRSDAVEKMLTGRDLH
ncbi:MAG: serine/threonine-protein kinase [Planctomycetota bacterium]